MAHLCICQGSAYFVNEAMQGLFTPDNFVAKIKLKMPVKLHFRWPVPQIQGHCLAKPFSIKPVLFPLYLITVK